MSDPTPPDTTPNELPPPLTMATQADSASVPLREIADWDGVSQDSDIHRVVTTAFEAEDYLECIKNLREREIDPESYINNLDKIIDSLPAGSDLRRRCIRALRKTCGIYGILPASYTITRSLTRSGSLPIGIGGFGDVWKLTDEHNMTFAAKTLRVCEADPVERINKKYCKEVIIQKRVTHGNVLTIEGVARDLFKFGMVSQWMENGDLLKYAKANPGVNRLNLLIGVTRGLDYLHRNEVIHGDLKSSNILVDAEGCPRLSDFGLSSITTNIVSVNASTPNHGCTVRYCAPELIVEYAKVGGRKYKKSFDVKCTQKADVYSLSMVIVELATGVEPFPELQDHHVILKISKGGRPKKPRRFDAQGITTEVWKVARKCWHQKAGERPEVERVLQSLEGIANADDGQPEASKFGKVLCHMLG